MSYNFSKRTINIITFTREHYEIRNKEIKSNKNLTTLSTTLKIKTL